MSVGFLNHPSAYDNHPQTMARIYPLSYLWCSKVHLFSWSRPHEFWERENWWVFVGSIIPVPSWQVTYPLWGTLENDFPLEGMCTILSSLPEISKITKNLSCFFSLTLFCFFCRCFFHVGDSWKTPCWGFYPFFMLPGCRTLCDQFPCQWLNPQTSFDNGKGKAARECWTSAKHHPANIWGVMILPAQTSCTIVVEIPSELLHTCIVWFAPKGCSFMTPTLWRLRYCR